MALLLVVAPLPSAPPQADYGWAVGSGDGKRLQRWGRAVPALLPNGNELVLCLPAAALSWHQVTLPPGSLNGAARLRSVLNGLLEDRLLDAPDLLHFALEPGARAGALVRVAACNRLWLHSAVQALESVGRRVTRIVPEFTPQPATVPVKLVATGTHDAAQLTICDAAGVTTLPLDGASLARIGGLPEGASTLAEPGVAALAETLFGHRVPIVTSEARWFEQASSSPWDLAQFDLASTGRARAGKQLATITRALWRAPRWRAARWGVLVLVLAQLIGLNAWAWKTRSALAAQRSAVVDVLTRTFPSVRVVVDAPLQMAREVSALQRATGGVTAADLEPMLGAVAASMPAGRSPSAIDFSPGQLRLRGLGLQASEGSALVSSLSRHGYDARIEGDLLQVRAEPTR